MSNEKGAPGESPMSRKIPYWRMVIDQGAVTQEVIDHPYPGSGTEEDPYAVTWLPNDPRNPMQFANSTKWFITMLAAISTLAVALVSSAYTGGVAQIRQQFHVGTEVSTLGVSLFVLGFAIGSSLFCCFVFWNIIGLTDFHTGPVLGPIIGGFLGMNAGWRWVMGFLGAFSGFVWIVASLLTPETYAPVLLRRRAERLSKITGKVYRSKLDIDQGKVSLKQAFGTALSRPWILLFREPIVFLLSLYMAIVYGTLYMLFAAYPIVFQGVRGWNQGVGSLPFLGIMIGMLAAVAYSIIDNKRYVKTDEKHGGFAPPEARLPPCMVASLAIPIGLFWFAWTNYPSIHWMACVAAGAPFGFGMVLVFLSILTYLIDTYTIFAASVLAANSVLRSIFGAVFPLFTTYMYSDLGIHWASTIPAFLALACVPFPFLFYIYGPKIRLRCKYAAESDAFMRKMAQQIKQQQGEPEDKELEPAYDRTEAPGVEVSDSSDDESGSHVGELPPVQQVRTKSSVRTAGSARQSIYDGNPYDIDRVHTRESFK
ncbi:unnamed protein product [Aspergillus oryzae]|uniref:Unnamed protein product n=2 Tax=Aspergillus oryzae TaxID=5062 RepID=A0AAN4YSE4_ASPOZ|nr:unnamed protein product [Aspergillus oryzae]GMF88134.1 unnamed protein product [Aspergillus oryzae]GMG14517.1 unnamed protein product [Aspergillus oryzae]GMG34139.1 unnamed protein product [Aspergillus oryzae]GMG51335.1 unnamed protein product [Aspergillus oryzae var. brunneus]